MDNSFAIILGAGFSNPAGLPLAGEINKYFLRNNADTLLNFGSGEWKWIDYANGPERNNGKLGYNYFSYGIILNQWVRFFIEFNKGFSNYEDFYQFINDNHRNKSITDLIYEKAYDEFLICHPTIKSNPFYHNYTFALTHPQYDEIKSIINHLISDLLYIRKQKEEYLESYYAFLRIMSFPMKIDIVTLNHDFLLESLLEQAGILYSDGFSINKSPLELDGGKKIKFFNNEFDNDVSIIKLHGSIDVYKFFITKTEGSLWSPTGDYLYYKTHNYVEKQKPNLVDPDTGEVFQNFNTSITPQFITGTRKEELIANDTMYASLYSEFDKRIHQNSNLLIIGYSFADKHVNEKIISAINSGKILKVVNVNPYDPFPYPADNIKVVNLKNISELHNSIFQDE